MAGPTEGESERCYVMTGLVSDARPHVGSW